MNRSDIERLHAFDMETAADFSATAGRTLEGMPARHAELEARRKGLEERNAQLKQRLGELHEQS